MKPIDLMRLADLCKGDKVAINGTWYPVVGTFPDNETGKPAVFFRDRNRSLFRLEIDNEGYIPTRKK